MVRVIMAQCRLSIYVESACLMAELRRAVWRVEYCELCTTACSCRLVFRKVSGISAYFVLDHSSNTLVRLSALLICPAGTASSGAKH